jgi:hypothetical protein
MTLNNVRSNSKPESLINSNKVESNIEPISLWIIIAALFFIGIHSVYLWLGSITLQQTETMKKSCNYYNINFSNNYIFNHKFNQSRFSEFFIIVAYIIGFIFGCINFFIIVFG